MGLLVLAQKCAISPTIMTTVTLIIPTHNRSTSLRRTLDALCLQTCRMDSFDVLVVADGCTDDTAATAHKAPFGFVSSSRMAVSRAARNRGAASRRRSAFLATMSSRDRRSWLGMFALTRIGLPTGDRRLSAVLRDEGLRQHSQAAVVERHIPRAGLASARFTYRDVLSGNFSIGRTCSDGLAVR